MKEKKVRGFTLIELMIVVAIIGIFAMMLPIYGWLNSKVVVGTVDKIVPLLEDGGMAVGEGAARMAKSTAVSLKLSDGGFFTFSSEDRQWFALKGETGKKCVKAKAFPYAPWNFSKSGTYYGGRLLEMAETCDKIK
jgi:prepilin-type N-terminal cleavage/methylation domain-containing protein